MCGICGVLQVAPGPLALDPALLDRMTDALAHRGPDDRGTWRGERAALGARRLAVIDLSPAGHQPMASEDGSVVLAYNGEVYNFRELARRHDLERRHHFRSRTDTEVLLHLYREMGMEMLGELNGMFALALWDAREDALFLARDRYGIKPLFWQRDDTRLRFGSEIKAILQDPEVPRQTSLQAMHDYLTLGYVPGAQTAFSGIHELPPAHWMRVGHDGAATLRRWWELPFGEDDSLQEGAVAQHALSLMDRAVERRLVADVPVGVLLSGGMDSSAVTALMRRHVRGPIHTYAVGFDDASFDERDAARTVARHLGTEHREVVVTAERVRELIPGYLRWIDEPYADGSAIPTWCVSRLAKGEVVVLLSGEGGDEVFAGYETHAAYKAAAWGRRVPAWVRNGLLAPLVGMLPVSHTKLSLEFRMKRFLGGLDLSPVDAHLWWRIILDDARKRALYAPGVLEAMAPEAPERHFREVFGRSGARDGLNRLLHVDSAVFLPDDLMIKTDRMTMAHSLEARVPFTDPELTEWMATVPARLKLPGLRKKHLMRRALQGLLPDEILGRKKVGLELPYSRWLAAELKDLLLEWCGPGRVEATGLFRAEAVDALVREHLERRHDHGRPLWALMNFMMWHELYLS
ncbi:MAG TPA: asparagine synthase (glutamine-hydrolyzing) [Longimicrobiales bacterium]|nr:asparagine synthase (glutamine-hydrolyzing) [Longimicrobiales bacterium]